MHVEAKPSAIGQTKPREFAVRFFFGGLVTLIAGLIAHRWGPIVGGLFLAFPAIFPASCTLVQKHEDHQQRTHGRPGQGLGPRAAGVEAVGAVCGGLGLIAFAAIVWLTIALWPLWLSLTVATLVWFALALTAWAIRQRM